ncbi:MAG TPA: hypothetical protein VH142_15450 [Polyangiaceae bacterium]|jgi:hypothetical protein|nr:hypothetical protein [Polyangiaceae bacterium]
MRRLAAACCLIALAPRVALAAQPVSPSPDSETANEDTRERQPAFGGNDSRHLLVYPTFVPSTLVLTYAGLRLGAAYDWSNYRPFASSTGNTYSHLAATGGIDVSKVLINQYVAMLFSATGTVHAGVNAGTFVADGANFGGGFDFGAAFGGWLGSRRRANGDTEYSTRVRAANRLGGVIKVGQTYGTSVLLLRALSVVNANLLNEQVDKVTDLFGPAAGTLFVPFVEDHARADFGWAFVPLSWFSLQSSVGVEHVHRYYRAIATPGSGELSGLDVDQFTWARLGIAAEFMPPIHMSFVLEYQGSTSEVRVGSVEQALDGQGEKLRIFSQLVAASAHFTDPHRSDLDAAITIFLDSNPLTALSDAIGFGYHGAVTELGVQLSARYIW